MQGRPHPKRRGFTLVELLVVISIIAFIGSLAWFIGSSMSRSERVQRGGASVASTFQIAKQMALRDRIGYGVRLVPDGEGHFNGLEYVHQPPDYVQNRYQPVAGNPYRIEFELPIDGGLGPNKALWPIQVGDFIQENNNPPRRIVRVGPDLTPPAPLTPLPANQIETQSPSPSPNLAAYSNNFRVMRAPRPVPGEEIVQLPDDIVIDGTFSKIGTSNNALPNAPPNPLPPIPSVLADPWTGRVDIMFAPAQGVVGSAGRAGQVILWVRERDPLSTFPQLRLSDNAIVAGTTKQQLLIVVFTRTGAVASYAVDNSYVIDPQTGLINPYRFTKDPRPTGS